MATYSGSPRTWTAGETVTAALMNSDVRDPLAALTGGWSNSWTTRIDQGASTSIAHTTVRARYIQVGQLVICMFSLAATAGGTSGSPIQVVPPVGVAYGGNSPVGIGQATLSSTIYPSAILIDGDGNFSFTSTTGTPSTSLGNAIALASADSLRGTCVYEAA